MSTPGYHPLPSPHAHAAVSIRGVMGSVILALLPAAAFGIHQFGWPALNLLLVTLTATLVTEAACVMLAARPVRTSLTDGSGVVTALVLAMSLPPWAPWWIGAVGGLFAALLGKHVFGGLGQNLFNPAMLARVALLISFPVEMTAWHTPKAGTAPGWLEGLGITFGGSGMDAVSSASLLGHARTELARGAPMDSAISNFDAWGAAVGNMAGSLGETSALLIAAGGIFLLLRRIITWHIPVAMIGSVAVASTLLHWAAPDQYAGPVFHLLSGGLMLGAFFIATDPVGAPATAAGKLLFGAGCGLLVYIIRTWGGYPEGVAFAVLIMNAATPVIDNYIRPRIYGRNRNGRPLGAAEPEEP